MKPSQKQKDLIAKISSEIAGWANTNDIDSSSHWNLIFEFCETFELQVEDEMLLNEALDNIMAIIKRTKEQ
jgi:acyl carrier protein